jgi:hypothetical protein
MLPNGDNVFILHENLSKVGAEYGCVAKSHDSSIRKWILLCINIGHIMGY